MQGKDRSIENAPLAVQELIRGIVSAIRAVRLYPPNNPVYAQTIAKSYKLIEGYLRTSPEFCVTVHKTGLLYNQILVDRDAQLSKSISDDLYAKGVREITITGGLSEQELRDGYSVLALSHEEVKQKGSTASLLWERGVAHMKVKEASLDEIVRGEHTGHGAPAARGDHGASVVNLQELLKGKKIDLHGKKVMLDYISGDPAGFGQAALEMAREAGETRELQEGRLFEIYRETGRQMLQTAYEQRELLFDALARSLFPSTRLFVTIWYQNASIRNSTGNRFRSIYRRAKMKSPMTSTSSSRRAFPGPGPYRRFQRCCKGRFRPVRQT